MITRFGEQDGTEVGSHHPLIAFVAEAKMIANAWMRTGDSAPQPILTTSTKRKNRVSHG